MTPDSNTDTENDTMEATSSGPMEDHPITVPLAELSARTPPAKLEPIVRLHREEPNEIYTPAIRIPVRMLSKTNHTTTNANHGLLISPSRKVMAPGLSRLPVGAEPKLKVLRGVHINTEYPIYKGVNFMGRRDEEPIDIDLENQEPPDRIWTSRKHAAVYFQDGVLEIEDLNSLNGTFVNRNRVAPGQRLPLHVNDVIQVGTIQLRVLA